MRAIKSTYSVYSLFTGTRAGVGEEGGGENNSERKKSGSKTRKRRGHAWLTSTLTSVLAQQGQRLATRSTGAKKK